MSFSLMPKELNCHVVNFIEPTKVITNKEIKCSARQFVAISLVNKEFNQICSEKLVNLKKINDLVNKYNNYNDKYEYPRTYCPDPKGNPQLLDALFTGCTLPLAYSTFNTYTPEIEQDIKDIAKLTPQSMNCVIGELKCREEVLPLAAACFNVNIPLHIIEFLLQQGANPNTTLLKSDKPISILEDVKNNVAACDLGSERFAAIKALFSKYGAV